MQASQPVTYGRASADSHKGEDTTTAIVGKDGSPSCFGVFDGHTGKEASRICEACVCQRLIADARGPPLPTAAIEDAFWNVDLEIGERGLNDGATATVLWVESAPVDAETAGQSAPLRESEEGAGLRCVLAWVGDSTAMTVDMRTTQGGVPLAATTDHKPGSRSEQERIKRMQAARDEPSAASADEAPLFTRAFARAKAIAEQRSDGADSRRRCLFINRSKPDASDSVRPLVVATEEHHAHPHYYDLQMTRSIGDWLAADLVLPDPEFLHFEVGRADTFVRVVLASDGLWDVASHQTVAKLARRAKTPQACADALLGVAERAYVKERGLARVGDDVSVLVVDLNPGGAPFEAPVEASGCCEIL